MNPKKMTAKRKSKKTSKSRFGKSKILAILVIVVIVAFAGWTFPVTTTQNFNLSSAGISSQTYTIPVKTLHTTLIFKVSYSGTAGAILIALINPNGVYVYNYSRILFDGSYSTSYVLYNATSGDWQVKVSVGLGSVNGTITVTSMGLPWNYVFGTS